MGMLNRVATETTVGAGMTGGGLTVEIAKKVEPVDIMMFDWIFWTPNYVLHTGGLIALIGTFVILHGAYRGHNERKRREAKESEWIDKIK